VVQVVLKPDAAKKRIEAALEKNALFKGLDKEQINTVRDYCSYCYVSQQLDASGEEMQRNFVKVLNMLLFLVNLLPPSGDRCSGGREA
jgi:hypothetical protein